ncbi:MAG TPA: [protein-PII] uridylyltransferase [Candidatus Binatia bacterium]|jgi:[protein-PII] uridylyltransferase|nr:[protein-PII] uridylyltransferase [Candidatus Binatia bacterium]
MQELVRKIEADAAARLPLPPGRQATQELARYKAFLKVETHRLKMLHRAGGGGLEVCRARATILDVLLRYLWDSAKAGLTDQAQKEFPALAMVAIGGYGRAELNPHSDVDFMFLHNRQIAASRPLPYLSKIIDGILYPLWDIGLKIGHSVRTIDECVGVANGDMQAKTSLIESRLVAGDEALFNKFQKTLVSKCVRGHEDEYIAMRIEDQNSRRTKYGNSASMQEPHLKNGCGGLRDHQNLLWMAFFKYHTRSLTDLKAHELITESERKQVEAAYDFLLRVRTEMHYHVNRPVDVLSKNLQPTVAHNLGYRERSPSRRIEEFMRDVYTHSRNIFLITRTLEQRMALLPKKPSALSLRAWLPEGRKRAPEIIDGFKILDGEIHAAAPRVFREQPHRLMRVFLYAQQRRLGLNPDLAQLIRNQLGLVDRAFMADQHVRETFLTLLNERGNVAPVLRAMHEVDFLGKYLPEFGKLTCLVQHEFYHQYTADEHTLMCVEQLDRVWEAKQLPYSGYTQLFQGLDRPFLLYLALLLHDVGKPDGHGNHAEVSAELAARVSKRLALDGNAAHTLRVVIENHLLMASTSQRRDLDDPAVIRSFAKQVQNPENLALLTIHTFVDSQATSDKLWNGFKDSLLWSLHLKTMQVMSGGTEFVRAEEKQRELLMEEVQRLMPKDVSLEELHAHFGTLPPRYFQIHSAREVLDDLTLAHHFMRRQISEEETALAPVIDWQDQPDRACNAVKICTWDRAGLFRKIAGSLSAAGLNILSAQIFTRTDGIVLDTFFVNDARTGSLAGPEQRHQFQQVINRALTGEEVDFHSLIARQKITRPAYQAYLGERIPTRVRFDNDSSETRTLIEIETEDRIGLLYTISQTLTELDLDISAARICTERGAAIDSFYVRELDGGKILITERHQAIERKLRLALVELDKR